MSTARADAGSFTASRRVMRRRCRRGLALIAGLLLAPVLHAGEKSPPLPPLIEVRGGDFPVLVQPTHLPPPLDDNGEETPGCEAVRASRVDELPFPWRDAVDRIHLECDPQDTANDVVSFSATAFLKSGHVTMAGNPVIEIRLKDSELWGDHQYLIDAPFAEVVRSLRQMVETDCLQQYLREERIGLPQCHMQTGESALYLEIDEISGLWIHTDPDDAKRTVYAESWAD